MIDLFDNFLSYAVLLSVMASICCLIVLKYIFQSSSSSISFLYIPSGKSSTDAKLLGGLGISSGIALALISLLAIDASKLSLIEKNIFNASLYSLALITFFGYLDDRFEIRARYKLIFQLLTILTFVFQNSSIQHSDYFFEAIFLSIFLGMALLNGANVLDGLDTLSIKLGMVTSISFFYLGLISKSNATLFLSSILLSTLYIFSLFNREPAKIYLGEIGVSTLGFVFFVQANLCYFKLEKQIGSLSAFSLILIATSTYLSELGISFMRRLWNKKSPFIGDKLHLHYIIKFRYKISASKITTIMGLGTSLIISLGFFMAYLTNPIISLILTMVTIIIISITFCKNEWKIKNNKENTQNFFTNFEGKTVNIIDSNQFNSLSFSILNNNHISSLKTKNRKLNASIQEL